MSETAKCAGVMVNLDTGDVKLITLDEDTGEGMGPRFMAEALWESCKDDWPDYQAVYVENDACAELSKQQRLWQIGMCEDDEVTARIEAHNASVS